MNRKSKGFLGETRAAEYLQSLGYEILKRNFKGPRGEVDIIVRKEDILVFAEVKTYDTLGLESLEYAVGGVKQRKILDVARYFLTLFPGYNDFSVRFDVLLVSEGREVPHHLENAFTEFGVS